jgi:ubiquitin-like protein Pup
VPALVGSTATRPRPRGRAPSAQGGRRGRRPAEQDATSFGEAEETPQADSTEAVAERKERLDDDVDSILDEIDDVLEENAEEFVRGFVQKGGQ